jgi:polysaccharide biosynthesis transport protein
MAEERNSSEENRTRALQKAQEHPVSANVYYGYPEEEIHLRDYMQIILLRKWIVLTFFIAVVTTVTVGSFMAKPQYKSTVSIKIDKENPNILTFKDAYAVERPEEDYYQTQYKVLKSRNLARRVIRQMKLDANPEFANRKDGTAHASSFLKKETLSREDGIDSLLIDRFLDRMEVVPQQKSRLVNISFSSYDPQLSARVADAIAKSFIDLNIDSKFEAAQQGREWLEKQLDLMKIKIEQAEEKLNQYASKNEILFFETTVDRQGRSGTENIMTTKLSELSSEMTAAASDRIQKEALYNEIRSGDAESSSIVMANSLILSLKKDYAALESEYNQNLKIYKPDYPKMIKLNELKEQTRQRIEAETKKVISSSRKDYETALKRESYLKTAFEKQKQEALDLNDRSVQYQILKREADTNKELYAGLLQKLKETGISASLTASSIQILDRAEVPVSPFKPKRVRNILLSLFLGLFGGIGLAFFADYLDNTVKSPEDIEKKMMMPSLGLVPVHKKEDTARRLPVEFITFTDVKSHMSEAYASIRTFLLFSTAGKPPKVTMVTSARKGEGKTTTAVNIAISLTKSDSRVLLVDADMRRPRIHKVFRLSNTAGLSTFLSGNQEFSESMIKHTRVPGLDIMTSGPIAPNPAELLGSSRLGELLEGLYPLYNFIIIDTPPLLGLADAAIVSTRTEGVIMVVRSGETPREAAQQAKKILEGVNAKVLGVVLNGMSESSMKYGNYSYYQSYYENTIGSDVK